jgi:dTDP-4-dehydrorhamnose 3,5-epimerase-like enzyme
MGPDLLRGGLAVDDRGEVAFVNDFTFDGVKRFYTVSNHRQGFVRAWHGHRHESKYVLAVSGAALVCCVQPDDWESPSHDLEVQRFVIGERSPAVVYVPPGYLNGFMTLTPDTKLMFFSTSRLEESLADDVRFPARYWDPWGVEER